MLSFAIFVLFQTLINTRAEERRAFFKIENNYVLFDESLISEEISESLISCSRLCTRDKRCKSANFIESKKTCSLLAKTRTTHPARFLKQANVIHLEKENSDLGSIQELAVPSCRSLSSDTHPSGTYWVDLDGGSHANAFKVYCEMETDGGGWTLVWSYQFTNYEPFWTGTNAVTPRPNWPANPQVVNVPMSTTPPLNETDYNAIDFQLWRQFGREILIKSNISNWLVCSPDTGSLVEWQDGNIICKIVKRVAHKCPDGPPPSSFKSAYCGPWLTGGAFGKHYYYFDGCTGIHVPTHDPCGDNKDYGLKNVENPDGNIFVR